MLGNPCYEYVLPFCLSLPDGRYDAIVDAKRYCVDVSFVPREAAPESHMPRVLVARRSLRHHGYCSYGFTRLSVLSLEEFDIPKFPADATSPTDEVMTAYLRSLDEWRPTHERLLRDAIQAGNRLIAVYRDQYVEPNGGPPFHPNPIDGMLDLWNIERYVITRQGEKVRLGFSATPPPAFPDIGPSPSEATVLARIAGMLLSDVPIPTWRLLIRNCQNWLWRGDYRLVPLEATIAFEATINYLLQTYAKSLHPLQAVSAKLTFLDKIIKTQEISNQHRRILGKQAIEWAPTKNNRGWEAFETVDGRNEVVDWYKHCYLARCRIVHDLILDVSRKEAEEALHTAEVAIEFVRKLDSL